MSSPTNEESADLGTQPALPIGEASEPELMVPGRQPEHSDWFLQALVCQVNSGNRYPIALTVGGSIITGVLIGGAEYFSMFSESFSELASDPEISETFRAWSSGYADMYKEGGSDEPTYIHLMEAQYFSGGPPVPSSSGLLWRGRLQAVEGFSLGRLQATAKET